MRLLHTHYRPPVPRRPPLVFIYAVTLTGILNNPLVTPALPDILTDFGVPDARSGLLVAAGSVAGIVVAPIVGVLADRLGRRLVLTTCLAIFGSFGVLGAAAPTFDLLVLARLAQGVGSAGLINLAVVLIGDHWSGRDRTRIVGRNSAVLTVGLAAIPLLSGVVTELAGWRVAFLIYSVALATAGAAWLVLESRRPESPPSLRDQLGGAAIALREPILVASIVSSFIVFMLIFGLILTVFPLHLADSFGMGAGLRGVMFAIPPVSATLVAYNLGRIRDAVSAKTLVIVSSAGLTAAFAALGMAGAVVVLAVAALVYGTAEGALIPTLQDLNIEGAPEEHLGSVIAAWVAAARVGQTIGPLLAGLSIGLFGTGSTLVVGSLLALPILALGVLGPFPGRNVPLARGQWDDAVS